MHQSAPAIASSTTTEQTPLCGAVEQIFSPLARLCLSNGMQFAEAEELLKRSFIQAAQESHPGLPEHGAVSRISAATGLNRREVTRLVRARAACRRPKISLVSEIIARWTALPEYRAENGTPRALQRQGEAPSFETLARSITRDVHPRSILEELLRLGIVAQDQAADQVSLCCSNYVPGQDQRELLTFLGDNVGDHLESAVANLVKDGIQHHDQAIFADELSQESVKTLAPLIMANWHRLRDDLVPAITACIENDRAAGRQQDQRVRIGLYSFSATEKDVHA